ncbi:UDP-N-acetylmuramate dehydrogenase [Pyruvatibacter mobilis]|uniref:UDP-N-acetylmuramate dehydrogenase n=1 Tax=Pyruvatibacter mobilis TaxID=1712261 RepID=UPI003D1156C8
MASASLISRLPEVRGSYKENAPLAPLTWFRVGGAADVLYMPADADDLAAFLAGCPDDVPLTVVGVGSNLLVRDGGIEGVVIRLGSGFTFIEREGDTCLRAGCAVPDIALAKAALDAGLTGLEFYRGIPGALGGALRMNAGAYGRETKDVLVEAEAVTRAGEKVTLSNADFGYSYRHSNVSPDLIFTSALFEVAKGDKAEIAARMDEITSSREGSQPIRSRTGGSTFKNPGGTNPDGPKAWKLIDAAGGRGLKRGGAQVSEQHCNFLINTGDATAADLEGLGEDVRARVKETSGVELEWEIKRIGRTAADAEGQAA